jgi:hypothetical protein
VRLSRHFPGFQRQLPSAQIQTHLFKHPAHPSVPDHRERSSDTRAALSENHGRLKMEKRIVGGDTQRD